MRDRGPAAANRPPLFGAGVHGEEEQPSQVMRCIRRYLPAPARTVSVCRWLFIDDAIVPSSVLDSPLLEVAMVPDSRKQSLCLRSLLYEMPSLFAVGI